MGAVGFFRTFCSTVGICGATCLPVYAQTAEYRLGPQDQLDVRVFDLRTGSGEAYKWPAFEGEYYVNASGLVSLPLLGEIQAADKTTKELSAAIGEGLRVRVGLATKPDAVVQVSKYRPFFVSGSVEKPGDYEYRPNLTVLQAVSMAGGLQRFSGDALLGFTKDALSSRGDLRVLTVDRLALLARQARLDAEIQGAPAVSYPTGFQAQMADPDIARLIREENLLFDSRRTSLQAQVDLLTNSKVILGKQLDTLSAKSSSLGHQLDLSRKELDQVSGLVSKGLVVLPRQLAIEQTVAQFESQQLDVGMQTLQAHQDLSKADQDIANLTSTRRNDTLQEATQVRKDLGEVNEKIATVQGLIFQAEVRAPQSVESKSGDDVQPTYLLTQRLDGKSVTREVDEGASVQPGAVVRVEVKRAAPPSGAASSASRLEQTPAVN